MMACGMTTASAQSAAENGNEAKEVFNPHWFIQAQGGVGATRGEADFSDLLSPAAALSAGYRFTPVVSARVGASGWQGKGGWVTPAQTYKYNYLQGNVDVLFDLSALFCKFNPNRVFNLYAFVGGGVNYAFDNDEAQALNTQGYELEYLWDGHKVSPVGRAGLGANFRVSKRVAINLEGNANLLSDHFNSKKAGNPDWQFNVLAGLTFELGKTTKTIAPAVVPPVVVPEEPAVVEEPVQVAPETPAPKVEVVKPLRENIFFTINSSVVRQGEMSKVENLIAYLNKYGDAKVSITGYADAATGNAKINQNLSVKRAKAVADELVKRGIDASRIVVNAKGDTVQPFEKIEENRVSICIAEK